MSEPSSSDSAAPIAIPDALLRAVYAEARRAYPGECCGWLSGPPGGDAVDAIRTCVNAQAAGHNPAAPERGVETAYSLSGPDQLAFARSFDGDAPARIFYHSHPNGRAYFSQVDHDVATMGFGEPAYPVQHLVVGIDGERVAEAAVFAWSEGDGAFACVARFPGADT